MRLLKNLRDARAGLKNDMESVDKNVLEASRAHIRVDSRSTNLTDFEKHLLIVTIVT